MSYLIRRDPFREIWTLRKALDSMFDDTLLGTSWESQAFVGELPLDVAETEDGYEVKASIPGINPDDLDITFSGKVLTIKGEFEKEEEKEDTHYHLRERRYGMFSRSITLPTPVLSEAIEAKYEAGVLTLRLPKTEEVKAKRITVHSAGTPQMIEGRAKEIASKN